MKTWAVEMMRDRGLSPIQIMADELKMEDGCLVFIADEGVPVTPMIVYAISAGSWISAYRSVLKVKAAA